MAETKKLEDYEYRIEVREVDPDTGNILLVFSEVDGHDGFGVTVSRDFLQKLVDEGGLDEWAESQIKRRLEALKVARAAEEKKREARKTIESIEKILEKKRVKLKKRRKKGEDK